MQDRFEEIRGEIEAMQRSSLWPGSLCATRNFYDFLWNGCPKPKVLQGAGFGLFGVYFLAAGVSFISISYSGDLGWFGPPSVIGAILVLFSLRVLRNAFVRLLPPSPSENAHRDPETST